MSHREQLEVLSEVARLLRAAKTLAEGLTAEHDRVKRRVSVALSEAVNGARHEQFCVGATGGKR